jgi:hypothetical protein
MSSIKKCILIPLEKYNQLLSASNESRQVSSKEERNVQSHTANPQILYEPEQIQSGGGDDISNHSKWLLGIPKLFKRNVQAVVNHFLDHKDILSWNNLGEIAYKGNVIAGSNLSDLLKDSQRHYKQLDPVGDREFYRAWAELNIPEGLLANEKRKTQVRYYKNNPNDQYIPPPPGIPQKRKSIVRKRKGKGSFPKWLKL